MTRSAYDRWLKFIATGARTGATFPSHEAHAIIKADPPWPERNWRRNKREINKAAALARRGHMVSQRPNLAPQPVQGANRFGKDLAKGD